ncbi:Hypothetical predicted protein, partial [Paramuricea clavata]
MEVEQESRNCLTINTHQGLYRYNRLVFGVTSAPAIWQRSMDQVLEGVNGTSCILDDMIITGKDDDEHLENLKEVLKRLKEHGIFADQEDLFHLLCRWMQSFCLIRSIVCGAPTSRGRSGSAYYCSINEAIKEEEGLKWHSGPNTPHTTTIRVASNTVWNRYADQLRATGRNVMTLSGHSIDENVPAPHEMDTRSNSVQIFAWLQNLAPFQNKKCPVVFLVTNIFKLHFMHASPCFDIIFLFPGGDVVVPSKGGLTRFLELPSVDCCLHIWTYQQLHKYKHCTVFNDRTDQIKSCTNVRYNCTKHILHILSAIRFLTIGKLHRISNQESDKQIRPSANTFETLLEYSDIIGGQQCLSMEILMTRYCEYHISQVVISKECLHNQMISGSSTRSHHQQLVPKLDRSWRSYPTCPTLTSPSMRELQSRPFMWFGTIQLRVIGRFVENSGFEDGLFQAGLCSSGSITGVMSGKHYNRCWLVHEAFSEALERLFVKQYLPTMPKKVEECAQKNQMFEWRIR